MRTLTSKPKVLDGAYEWEVEEADTDPRKPDLEVEPGVHRAVWDLRWTGAEMIPGGKLDTGDPKRRPAGVARDVHRDADGGRPVEDRAAGAETGPAGDGAGRGSRQPGCARVVGP